MDVNENARRMKVRKLRNTSVKSNFQEHLKEKLRDINETTQSDTEEVWRHLKSALIEAVKEVCVVMKGTEAEGKCEVETYKKGKHYKPTKLNLT